MRNRFLFLPLLFLSFAVPPDCGDTPQLNKQVVAFVKQQVTKKVGRGECWDLAAAALDNAGASWDHDYGFGRKIDPKKNECIFPGDIIQFENVQLDYRKGNTVYREDLAHHTAVIVEVKPGNELLLAQQNTTAHGRKVGLDPFTFSTVTRGKYTVYRPEK